MYNCILLYHPYTCLLTWIAFWTGWWNICIDFTFFVIFKSGSSIFWGKKQFNKSTNKQSINNNHSLKVRELFNKLIRRLRVEIMNAISEIIISWLQSTYIIYFNWSTKDSSCQYSALTFYRKAVIYWEYERTFRTSIRNKQQVREHLDMMKKNNKLDVTQIEMLN